MKYTVVNAEEIRELKTHLRGINSLRFGEIEFREDGKPVEIDEEIRNEWKFIGLNNADFIDTKTYKVGFE